jgi:hypothetical protein
MTIDDKTLETKMLLKRVYPTTEIFAIGKEQALPYFDQFVNAWEPDPDEAAMELAQALDGKQLTETFRKHPPRNYVVFRGAFYTFEDANLTLKGSTEKIRAGIAETEKKYGKAATAILKLMAQGDGNFGSKEQKDVAKLKVDAYAVLGKLAQLKACDFFLHREEYREWRMLEETLPLIRDELGIAVAPRKPAPAPAPVSSSASSAS